MPATVTLASNDGFVFDVDQKEAECSALIKGLIEDLGERAFQQSIPLPEVDGQVLRKVLDWCEQHVNDPEEPEDDPTERKRTDDISEWDQNFMDVGQDLLFKIVSAANYLDIKPLLSLGCKTIANMIKGKSPEQIRTIFNIVNELTPEEEEQIRRENEWIDPANTDM